jgi:hypothetical protein
LREIDKRGRRGGLGKCLAKQLGVRESVEKVV